MSSIYSNIQNNKETPLQFYKRFALLSVPIIFQQLVYISLNLIDNIMVGRLGTNSIAAVGFANKIYFVYILTIFGAFAGIAIFMAQYYGKRDYKTVRKLFALSIIIGLIIASLFTFVSMTFATPLISLFSKDPQVINLGKNFLFMIAISFPALPISYGILTALRSIGHTKQALYITIIATSTNTFLNYCLIYGNLGFPRLETKGAAIATVTARFIETICFLYLFSLKKFHLRCHFKKYFGLSKHFLKSIFIVSFPVFFTELIWVTGTTILAIAYAKLGTTAAAATTISELVVGIASIIFMGLATGSNIIIAQTIGSGNQAAAIIYGNRVLKLSLVCAALLVLLALSLIKPILFIYNLTPEGTEITRKVLFVMSFALFFKMVNWAVLIGIIRAGGDTRIAFLIDVVPLSLYAVPMSFVAALIFKLPIYYVVLLTNLEEVIKFVIALLRFRSKKWIHDLTKRNHGL